MRRTLLAGVAVAMLAAPSAHAHPGYHYVGGCSFNPVGDGSDNSDTTWTGLMSVNITATHAETGTPVTAAITAICDLYINDVWAGEYLRAIGFGFAAAADEATYTADPDDVVTLCETVLVGPEAHIKYHCANVDTTNAAPPPPPSPFGPVSLGPGCFGGWTDSRFCVFNAPARAFVAGGFAQQYTGPIGSDAHVTMRVYVLIGTSELTIGGCSSTEPGVARCSVAVETPYANLPHFCEVTGPGNYGWFGCGDPPPLPAG